MDSNPFVRALSDSYYNATFPILIHNEALPLVTNWGLSLSGPIDRPICRPIALCPPGCVRVDDALRSLSPTHPPLPSLEDLSRCLFRHSSFSVYLCHDSFCLSHSRCPAYTLAYSPHPSLPLSLCPAALRVRQPASCCSRESTPAIGGTRRAASDPGRHHGGQVTQRRCRRASHQSSACGVRTMAGAQTHDVCPGAHRRITRLRS